MYDGTLLRPARELAALRLFLSRRARGLCAAAISLSALTGLLEAAAIAVIMPFTALLVPAAKPLAGVWAQWMAWLPAPDDAVARLAIAVSLLLGVFLLKFAVELAAAWVLARTLAAARRELGERLLDRYLTESYPDAMARGTARTHTVLSHDLNAGSAALHAAVLLARELFALGAILAFLAVIQADVLLFIAFGVALPAYGVLRLLHRAQAESGVDVQRHQQHLSRQIVEALSAYKELIVLERREPVRRRLADEVAGMTAALGRQSLTTAVSRPIVELCAAAALAATLAYLVLTEDPALLLPSVAVFVAAAFRLTPGVSRIVLQWSRIVHSATSLRSLASALAVPPAAPAPARPAASDAAVVFEQVGFRYPGSEHWALRDLDLHIPRQCLFGIAGPSGAGKSTLADLILGIVAPTAGRIRIGAPAAGVPFGYVPQNVFVAEDSVLRNVALGLPPESMDRGRAQRALEAAQLWPFVEGLPRRLDEPLGEKGLRLSAGQRQRIGIARALYHDPPILVLDEAAAALDTVTERAFMAAVAALRGPRTIVVIAHRLASLRDCDRILLLDRGAAIACGTYAELLDTSPVFAALAGQAAGAR